MVLEYNNFLVLNFVTVGVWGGLGVRSFISIRNNIVLELIM